jgi:hypothetical protein
MRSLSWTILAVAVAAGAVTACGTEAPTEALPGARSGGGSPQSADSTVPFPGPPPGDTLPSPVPPPPPPDTLPNPTPPPPPPPPDTLVT